MRIIGYIQHPAMKITVFKMDSRITVKFEIGQYEQAYKFRITEGIETIRDIEMLVDKAFQQKVLDQFEPMHELKKEATQRHLEENADGFDNII